MIGSTGADTFNFTGTGSADVIQGDGGNNTLNYSLAQDNTWNITVDDGGNVTGGLSFTGIQNITGGPQSDEFIFLDQKGLTGLLSGGSACSETNTLNYAAYTTVATSSMPPCSGITGTATNITGGIKFITNFGEPGNIPATPIDAALTNQINSMIITSFGFYEYTFENNYNLFFEVIGFWIDRVDETSDVFFTIDFDRFFKEEREKINDL